MFVAAADPSLSPLGHAASMPGSPLAASAASSPGREPRVVRSMPFGGGSGGKQLAAQHVHWGNSDDLVQAQRVGRRPSFSERPSGGRRVAKAASGAAQTGAGEGNTEEAVAVRPITWR